MQSEVITGPVTVGSVVNVIGLIPVGTCNPEFGITANIGTTNNDNIDQCICGDLEIASGPLDCPAVIAHNKEFTSITQTGDEQWDVKWTITVSNTGLGDGTYNLNDKPAFDDDITICDAEYSTFNAPGNAANPGPLMLSNDGNFELAEDQVILAGETHTYCLVVCVQSDPSADPVIGDGVYTGCELSLIHI